MPENDSGDRKAGDEALTLIKQHILSVAADTAAMREDMREIREHMTGRAKLLTGGLTAAIVVLLGTIGALAVMLLDARAPL